PCARRSPAISSANGRRWRPRWRCSRPNIRPSAAAALELVRAARFATTDRPPRRPAMSLTGAYDPDNIFARILRGDMPAVKVWEDDRVLAFMDVFPQSEGHVLVVSRTSTARNLLEIEPEDLAALTAAVQRTARAVVEALRPDGFSIMQFNGEAGGQTVFHLHFHVIP